MMPAAISRLSRNAAALRGDPTCFIFPPGVPQSLLRDPDLTVVITEGEFKRFALWRAAREAVSRPRFLPLGSVGCLQLRGTKDKTIGPDGSQLRSKPPMNTTEGRILPVLANAIAAFWHALD